MLEKNEKKLYSEEPAFCDAHFHYFPSFDADAFNPPQNWSGISCAHSIEEWHHQKLASEKYNIYCAFGVHPQQAGNSAFDCVKNLDFLENLLEKNDICAIGECGFDFFTDEYKSHSDVQQTFFENQLELAAEFKKPVIIHCRKATDKLFANSRKLAALPSVLFHSFMGTHLEAASLLNHGINGYFSFGKQIFNNNKKVICCVKGLPLDRLLLETDAPYQFLKGESKTGTGEICRIYEGAFNLRKDNMNFSEFSNKIFENLLSLLS